jgi:hypothetical protein
MNCGFPAKEKREIVLVQCYDGGDSRSHSAPTTDTTHGDHFPEHFNQRDAV